jgi:hypothetical protein
MMSQCGQTQPSLMSKRVFVRPEGKKDWRPAEAEMVPYTRFPCLRWRVNDGKVTSCPLIDHVSHLCIAVPSSFGQQMKTVDESFDLHYACLLSTSDGNGRHLPDGHSRGR